ncbi:MAG: D-aminoacylase [Bacillota bacterium]
MYDYILRDATVVDGTGRPGFPGDVAVRDGRVVAMGRVAGPARREIRVDGRVVCPGFIDIHSHSDLSLPELPTADSKVMQGVTTEVVGNCGFTLAPTRKEQLGALRDYLSNTVAVKGGDLDLAWTTLGQFMDWLQARGISVNVATLVGQGTLRVAVMGFAEGPPDESQLRLMKEMLTRELAWGAFGISAGLPYIPDAFTTPGELVELCRLVRQAGGITSVHLRDEGAHWEESLREVVQVVRETGVSLEISHLKAEGRRSWGKGEERLKHLRALRREGLPIDADQYPYTAFGSGLQDLVPPWVRARGVEEMARLLKEPAVRERVKAQIYGVQPAEPRWEPPVLDLRWRDVIVSHVRSEKNSDLQGRTLQEIADARGQDPADVVMDLLVEERAHVKMVVQAMQEEDVRTILADPDILVASDGRATSPRGPDPGSRPHPRYYGTFPRVLASYVREQGLLSMEAAIRKMTWLPARKLGLQDRGVIAPGCAADLCVFDPDRIQDHATFQDPHRFPAGIDYVFVNGVPVVEEGSHTGARPGRVLRRPEERVKTLSCCKGPAG